MAACRGSDPLLGPVRGRSPTPSNVFGSVALDSVVRYAGSPINSWLGWRRVSRYVGMPKSGKPVTVVAPSCPIDTSTIGSPKSLC
jgi:hypothetical protein